MRDHQRGSGLSIGSAIGRGGGVVGRGGGRGGISAVGCNGLLAGGSFCVMGRRPAGKAVDVLRVSAFLHHAVELVVNRGQCRVVGDQIHVRVGRQQPSSGQRRLRKAREHVRRRVDQLRLEASVFQTHLQVVLAQPSGEHYDVLPGKLLEVDVPQPRYVASVAFLVVDEERHHLRLRVFLDDLEVLVETGRVLREIEQRTTAAQLVGLQAAVLRVERVDRTLQGRLRTAQQIGSRRHGSQVVHHVGPAQRSAHGKVSSLFPLCRQGDLQGERDAGCGDARLGYRVVERRPLEPALRTPVGSQLAVLAERVLEHGRAALAHLRVSHGILRQAHVFGDAERHGSVVHLIGDIGAQRIVGVVDERRIRRAFQRADDAFLDAVDLAAPVQLIAEQVEKKHVGGLQTGKDPSQPQLVGLEHAPVGALRLQQRRGHARIQVRTGAVAHHGLPTCLDHVCQQVRRRRFAVRAHHRDRPFAQARCQMRDHVRIDVQRHFSGEIGRWTVEHVLEPPRGSRADTARGCELQSHTASPLLRFGRTGSV